MERKVCFISDAGNCDRGGGGGGGAVADICPKANCLPNKQEVGAFIDRMEGGERLHAETA